MTSSKLTIERLLTEAHAAAGPSGEQRVRALHRLVASLGSPATPAPILGNNRGSGAASSTRAPSGEPAAPGTARPPLAPHPPRASGASSASSSARVSPWAMVSVVAALLGLAGGYGVTQLDAAPAAQQASGIASSAAPTASTSAAPAALPADGARLPEAASSEAASSEAASSEALTAPGGGTSAAAREQRHAPPRATRPATAAPPDLHRALMLLREAQQQLGDGHAERALAKLGELEARAPGVLVEERETTRVLAWCARGEREHARRLSHALAATYPASVYQQRLAASCVAASDDSRSAETPNAERRRAARKP